LECGAFLLRKKALFMPILKMYDFNMLLFLISFQCVVRTIFASTRAIPAPFEGAGGGGRRCFWSLHEATP
jgi:hypothetical protein